MAMFSHKKDIDLIKRFVLNSVNVELEMAAVKAVGLHGSGELGEVLLDYLERQQPFPGLIRDDGIIRTAWESFLKLRLHESIWSSSLIERAQRLLVKYESKALDDEKVFLMMLRGHLEGLGQQAAASNLNFSRQDP
jgi:hypothetical protein